MRVSELMHTPAVTCVPTTTIREAGQLMARRHVGSVVVIDQVGDVAGIVTDRDIVLRGVAEGRSADVTVDTVMTRNVATIDTRADIADAAATMMTATAASASPNCWCLAIRSFRKIWAMTTVEAG